MTLEIQKRNTSLDLLRIIALFCVISVHFFLNNGFYDQTVVGKRMFIMTVMRSTFMVCVPRSYGIFNVPQEFKC